MLCFRCHREIKMSNLTLEYRIGKSVSLGRVREMLRDDLNLVEASTDLVEVTYMDSFDWRIFSDAGVIESEKTNGSTLLRWRELNSHNYPFSVTTDNEIDLAVDLPVGQLQKHLCKILKMRALIPQVRLRVKRHHWVRLNKEKKTVLRIDVEDYQLWNEEKDSFHRLEKRIYLIPVRGYQSEIIQADKVLRRDPIVEPVDMDIYLFALKTQGRVPGNYNPKSIIILTPDMRTDEATKMILLTMLDMLEANEEGVKNNIDSEFLHDFRIAVRKTRSVFSQIKGVFPKKVVDRYRKQFAWLGSLTGPARDMDVYLIKFYGYCNMLPDEMREQLHSLRSAIIDKKISSYKALAKGLKGKRYRRLLADYRKFLESPVPVGTRLLNADRPVKSVADARIWKMYRRAVKEGLAIGEESPDEDFHELRKTCKKLRYLIEFFQSLYDPELMSHLIETLKRLQDNLGDFNDLHVQMGALGGFLKDMNNQGPVSAETREAINILIENLNCLKREKRNEFVGRFKIFGENDNKQLYRQLFKSV
jgi:CHAD domain-containing protein